MSATELSPLEEEMDPAQLFEEKIKARTKTLESVTWSGQSKVQQLYRGATVFITGGSGFLGKQLIEKLCRSTEVAKIFILMRTKKNIPIQQRFEEMLKDPVFELVEQQRPGFAQKLVPVQGDAAELRLGLSDEDWKTVTEQTNIIFHMAATTRFDEALRVATMINVRGTREALTLGKACTKLRSFVHVSTAYAHAKNDLIKTDVYEDFYPSPVDPGAMIKMVESADDSRLNDITPGLIKGWPNTYSFAKAVAEELVKTECGDMPICIVRPAIVVCAHREPNPGWLDMSCVYGATAIILAPGLGLMHVACASDETRIGLVPVDYVNNAIITSAWETDRRWQEGETKIKIYTVTASTRTDILWGELHKTLNSLPVVCHTPASIWYNCAVQTTNPVLFWIYTWLFHMIPGYILDGVCLLIGKERRFVKLYTKMYKMSNALSYFTLNYWNFEDRNLAQMYDSLSPVDKDIFYFDIEKMDFVEYLLVWCVGIRRYIIKDGLKGTRYAMKKRFVFRILHYIITPIYFYLLFKVFCLGIAMLSTVFSLFW